MRYSPTNPLSRWLLPAVVGVLVLMALVPARWMRWVNGLGNPARHIVAPVSGPVLRVAGWVAPAVPAQPEAVALLERERDRWKQMYLDLRGEHDTWVARIEKQIGSGVVYSPLPWKPLLRPVIGVSAEPGGQLEVRAGTREGVEQNTIATTDGVQLVGSVVRVGGRSCTVRLITDRATGPLTVTVMDTDDKPGPVVHALSQISGGRFQGRLRIDAGKTAPQAGQVVRLSDAKWPRSAQMLVVGEVVDQVQWDAYGWCIVTVKPTLDLERLREVLLRVMPDEPEEPGRLPVSTDGGQP